MLPSGFLLCGTQLNYSSQVLIGIQSISRPLMPQAVFRTIREFAVGTWSSFQIILICAFVIEQKPCARALCRTFQFVNFVGPRMVSIGLLLILYVFLDEKRYLLSERHRLDSIHGFIHSAL